jgi:hypothetical protein
MPTAKKAYVSDGVNWLPLVSGVPDMAGYATTEYVDDQMLGITVSANPPAAPEQGDLWFDSDTQELFMYDSVYWVEVSGTAIDLTQYLTTSSASTTYLTKASASTTYLTQSSASTIYATQTALNNIDALPSQSGNSGKYLTTSGSVASWGVLDLSLYATTAALNNINGESDQFILPGQIYG